MTIFSKNLGAWPPWLRLWERRKRCPQTPKVDVSARSQSRSSFLIEPA